MARKEKNRKKEPRNYWPHIFTVVLGFFIIALSLIHSNKTMDMTMIPRLLAWTIALFLITLFLIPKSILNQLDLSILKRIPIPLFTIYLLTGIVSLIFVTNISASYYDLVKNFSSLLLLVYICLIMLKTPDWPGRLARLFVIAATVSLTLGYYEYISKLGFGFHPRRQIYEINVRMSHVNLYSSYVMLLIPFLVYGVIQLKKFWRALAIINLLASLLMVFIIQTRAVYLGTAFGIFTGFVLFLVFFRHFGIGIRFRNIILGAFLAAVAGVGALYISAPADNIYVRQVNSIFTDTENPRLLMWRITARMIADQPLTGAGAGNFNVVVQRYYGDFDFGVLITNWMRPHNDFLQVASERGIFGLLVYLAFFISVIYYGFRILRSEAARDKKILALLLLTGVFAYMVFAYFDFPLERPNHQVMLMIYVAAMVVLFHVHHPVSPLPVPRQKWPMLALLLLTGIGMKYSYEALQQEKQVVLARQYNLMEDWRGVISASREGQTPWKTLDQFGLPVVLYECLANIGAKNMPEALRTCEIARQHNPYRENVLTALSYVYLSAKNYDKAIECLNVLLGIFPKHTRGLTMLGIAYYETGQREQARQTLEKIQEEDRVEEIEYIYKDLKME